VVTVLHPALITILVMAAAISCPMAASVTHSMLNPRAVHSDALKSTAARHISLGLRGPSKDRVGCSTPTLSRFHRQTTERSTTRISLLHFAANPPPIGA